MQLFGFDLACTGCRRVKQYIYWDHRTPVDVIVCACAGDDVHAVLCVTQPAVLRHPWREVPSASRRLQLPAH